MSLPTLPTPVIYVPFFKEVRTVHQGDYYTAEQMQAYGKQCRAEALEEAAKCAEDYPTYGEATAEEIKSLKS